MPRIYGGYAESYRPSTTYGLSGGVSLSVTPAATFSFSTPSSTAWTYIGVPYPTDALPGLSTDSTAIPLMPTLPDGAHHTACDWYSGNPDSYDPCTIANPTPPSTVTANEYVVNKFDGAATDADMGDNAIGGVVYGTTARPRLTPPNINGVQQPAGWKLFIYGDGTPRPTAYNDNRKNDYDQWEGYDISFAGTAANPCWIVGIDDPRFSLRDKDEIYDTSHLIIDGVVMDGSDGFGGAINITRHSNHITVRNCAQYSYYKNGLFNCGDTTGDGTVGTHVVRYIMSYRNELAYAGFDPTYGSTYAPFTGLDKHGWRPMWNSAYTWCIECNIHSLGGDAIQGGNSKAPALTFLQEESPHYAFIAGNDLHYCGENAVDNKNSYHIIISQNNIYDFRQEYNYDGGTGVILSNNNEGPYTGYHWAIANEVSDCMAGIRSSGDQDGEQNYVIGNVVHNMFNYPNVNPHGDDGGDALFNAENVTSTTGKDCYWVNNTIFDTDRGWGTVQGRGGYNTDEHVHGNLFAEARQCHFHSTGTDVTCWDNNPQAYIEYNVIYGNTAGADITGWAAWTGNVIGDTATEDPGLNQSTFAISPTGSAANIVPAPHAAYSHYENLYGRSILFDFNGNARPSTNLSAGAVEA